jgi:aspartyl-tRNA synthetase
MNQSVERLGLTMRKLNDIGPEQVNQTIMITARVQTSRATGIKLFLMIGKRLFLTLRQQTVTAQSLLAVDEENISKQMFKFASGISSESLVRVEAVVTKSPTLIQSCTVQEYELSITKVILIINQDLSC